MQDLPIRAVHRAVGLEMDDFRALASRHLEGPAPGLRGITGQDQAVKAGQVLGLQRGAVLTQEFRRGHAAAPVVGQAHADQRRVRHGPDTHRAVIAFAGHVAHPVAQVQRDRHLGMQFPELGDQRGDVAAPEARWGGEAQMAAGFDAAGRHTGLGVGHIGQHPLAVFQEGAALVGERDAPGRAHQQLDAQPLFQCIQSPSHDGRGHALGLGGCSQGAPGGHRHKGLHLLELVHAEDYCLL